MRRGERVARRRLRGEDGGARRPDGGHVKLWPGEPFPLGATWDGEGTNFSLFSENAEHVELCLFDEHDHETRIPLTRARRRSTGTATCRTSGRDSATPTACTARGRPSDGHRFNPHKLLIDPYAKAIEGRGATGSAASTLPYVPGGDDADLEADDEDDAAAIPKCVVIDPRFDWEGDAPPPHAVARHRDLRGAREGVHGAAPGRARGPARHVRRPRLRGGDRALPPARRDRGRAPADPPHRRRAPPGREGADELLGLQLDRLLRPARAVRGDRDGRRAGARVQGDGEGAAPRRDRGDPRRRLQPHRRGQPPRADARLQGRRQRLVLPADAGRPALLHGLHRHREQPQPGAPERPPADHGLASLLGDRLPRRRVPVRPRLGARARVLRRRPPRRRSSTRSTRTRCSRR